MHLFFNDLFQRVGDPRRYNNEELRIVFNEADVNRDGVIDKQELLRVCKMIFVKKPYQGTVTTYIAPSPTYTYTYYVQRPVAYKTITTTTTYHHCWLLWFLMRIIFCNSMNKGPNINYIVYFPQLPNSWSLIYIEVCWLGVRFYSLYWLSLW